MCVVAGCSIKTIGRSSVHIFPKSKKQREVWDRFVKHTREDWSDHLENRCYEAWFLTWRILVYPWISVWTKNMLLLSINNNTIMTLTTHYSFLTSCKHHTCTESPCNVHRKPDNNPVLHNITSLKNIISLTMWVYTVKQVYNDHAYNELTLIAKSLVIPRPKFYQFINNFYVYCEVEYKEFTDITK